MRISANREFRRIQKEARDLDRNLRLMRTGLEALGSRLLKPKTPKEARKFKRAEAGARLQEVEATISAATTDLVEAQRKYIRVLEKTLELSEVYRETPPNLSRKIAGLNGHSDSALDQREERFSIKTEQATT